jgi:rhamnogalacturonan acetylesterase
VPYRVLAVLIASCVFSTAHAATPSTAPATDPKLPTLFLVGDSTVRVNTSGQRGWGDPIREFFDTSRINVVNRAIGGRSSRTFITEGRWDAVLKEVKKGDFVIIQFGHNDGGALSGDNRERGSIRGTGDETKDVTLTLKPNEGKKETVHTYGWYLRKYINDARAHGMTPIVCSPVAHAPKEKVAKGSAEKWDYVRFAEEVAQQEKAAFIPLNTLIRSRWAEMEPSEIKSKYFTPADGTHTDPDGARLNAQAAVEGIRALKELQLRSSLKE